MHLRGAIVIGAAAGWGMYLAAIEAADSKDFESTIQKSAEYLKTARPTAVNLAWGVDLALEAILNETGTDERVTRAKKVALKISEDEVERSKRIGEHGLILIREIAAKKPGQPVNILTHCNAGWLACVDYGTATAPMYAAHDASIPIHVWVDETRPRNQGARLTAWELGQHGVPHTVIADNTGGHLMQHGQVDLCIVGTDRTTKTGDVANKIGTYLKALAANDNGVPFYVALPSSSFDWQITNGMEIPIETRSAEEVTHISGANENGIATVRLTPESSAALNYGFDVTPARLVSALITERGICKANEESILELFPEQE